MPLKQRNHQTIVQSYVRTNHFLILKSFLFTFVSYHLSSSLYISIQNHIWELLTATFIILYVYQIPERDNLAILTFNFLDSKSFRFRPLLLQDTLPLTSRKRDSFFFLKICKSLFNFWWVALAIIWWFFAKAAADEFWQHWRQTLETDKNRWSR